MQRAEYRKNEWMWEARSPEEAVRLIESGHRIFLHGGCASSLPLEKALAERARGLSNLQVFQMHKEGPEVLAAPELAPHVHITSMFCGKGVRQAIAEGRADYLPVFLSEIPLLFRQGTLPIDVAIVQVSYPDAHGFCSLGTSVDVARQAFESARIRIAEVNWRMPRTHGDTFVPLERFDAFIVTDRPLCETPPSPQTEVHEAIGRHVAELVADGATLQIGIGAVGDAVVHALRDKRDLGVHTELFTDAMVDLIRSGAVTNRAKSCFPGLTVTSFVTGTRKVYDFVDDNPSVVFWGSDRVNDTALIRQHHRMTAINGAIQVDLTGQVCADSIGHQIYSGIGGQMDFMRGAALAPQGRAIIALPSTAMGGSASRIVATLSPGSGVVTTRGHVQYVVTEHGIADLRGRSIRERAVALMAIAHPDFREELRAQAFGRRAVPLI
jgi:acyl-CoA hydrolase